MKKTAPFILLLVIAAALSASPAAGKASGNPTKAIPDSFDTRKTILLISDATDDDKSDNMAKILKDKYPYKYEVISKDIDRDPKYDDRDYYRYVLTTPRKGQAGGVDQLQVDVYHIYDRKLNIDYPVISNGNGFAAASFKHTIDTIVKFLAALK